MADIHIKVGYDFDELSRIHRFRFREDSTDREEARRQVRVMITRLIEAVVDDISTEHSVYWVLPWNESEPLKVTIEPSAFTDGDSVADRDLAWRRCDDLKTALGYAINDRLCDMGIMDPPPWAGRSIGPTWGSRKGGGSR